MSITTIISSSGATIGPGPGETEGDDDCKDNGITVIYAAAPVLSRAPQAPSLLSLVLRRINVITPQEISFLGTEYRPDLFEMALKDVWGCEETQQMFRSEPLISHFISQLNLNNPNLSYRDRFVQLHQTLSQNLHCAYPNQFPPPSLESLTFHPLDYVQIAQKITLADATLKTVWLRMRIQLERTLPTPNLPSLESEASEIRQWLYDPVNAQHVEQVRYLDFSSSGIHIIPDEINIFTHLEDIELSRNHIKEVSSQKFRTLPFLQRLILSHNEIQDLSNAPFAFLRNLRILRLNRNKIQNLSSDSFLGLVNLVELRLAHNGIQDLSNAPFTPLISLQALQLNHNKIQSLQNTSLNGPLHLNEVYLNNNEIEAISLDTFLDIHIDRLEELCLAENPICKCIPELANKSSLPKDQILAIHSHISQI